MEIMKTDILIVGCGPAGLLAANFLAGSGKNIIIIDKRGVFDNYSKAIGVMPPSLAILHKIGLKERFERLGLSVSRAVIHGTKRYLGHVDFNKHRVLSIPQSMTVNILYGNLYESSNVSILFNMEFAELSENENSASSVVRNLLDGSEIVIKSDFVLGCDGGKSAVRESAGIDFIGERYNDTFLMGDYIDRSGFGDEAHLYFTHMGAIESFPLGEGRRRWIVQTDKFMAECPDGFLEEQVFERSGVSLESGDRISMSPFGVQHFVASSYFMRRVILCGDSAHLMSPIGGQGMNTGFADVELASVIIRSYYDRDRAKLNSKLKSYSIIRRRAALTAIRRSEFSMRIGTVTGLLRSFVRNVFIWLALHSPVVLIIPRFFAMMTIRNKNFDSLRRREKLFFKS